MVPREYDSRAWLPEMTVERLARASRRRHCERSEAIQGRAGKSWIASSQGLLAMTLIGRGVTPRSRDTLRPRFANSSAPKKEEGAGKTGCALHPRSHVHWVDKKTHMSIQVQRKQSGLPCAMVLRLIFVLSPVRPGLVCHRRQRDTKYHRQLDTCHWGVRTTRLCRTRRPRSSVAASASIAPRPAFRDECAYAPLVGRDGRNKQLIWVESQE